MFEIAELTFSFVLSLFVCEQVAGAAASQTMSAPPSLPVPLPHNASQVPGLPPQFGLPFPGMPMAPPSAFAGGFPGAMAPQQGIGSQLAGQDPKRSLFVGNISPFVSEGLLFHVFSSCGPVVACRIIRSDRPDAPRYGFVDYADSAVAAHAVQVLNNRIIFGTSIITRWAASGQTSGSAAESHQVYVGNISQEIDDQTLYRAFSAFKSIVEARIVRDADGNSRSYGFVTFRTRTDAEQAMVQMNGEWLGKRPLRVNLARTGPETGEEDGGAGAGGGAAGGSVSGEQTNTIFVGGLAPASQEFHIRQAIEEICPGRVVGVRMNEGFAFVDLASTQDATLCIEKSGTVFVNQRPVKIQWSRTREERRREARESGRGFGGDRYGGDRGGERGGYQGGGGGYQGGGGRGYGGGGRGYGGGGYQGGRGGGGGDYGGGRGGGDYGGGDRYL